MIRSILARLLSRSGDERDGSGEDDGEDDDEGGSGALRSRLDASVLEGHGMDVGRLEREAAEIEERAREIDEARRER
jgi:hypothetical protein